MSRVAYQRASRFILKPIERLFTEYSRDNQSFAHGFKEAMTFTQCDLLVTMKEMFFKIGYLLVTSQALTLDVLSYSRQ